MSRSLDIGLDIDGVLYPFAEVIASYACKVLGRPCSPEPETWEWYKRQWGLTTNEFLTLCRESINRGVLFTEGDPLPGALQAVQQLAQAGHRLHYVPARALAGVSASRARCRTAEWLAKWRFPIDSLTIADNEACRVTHVFLDDSPHLYDALVAAGHPRPVLWSHPCTLAHPADRVASWDEFMLVVQAAAGSASWGAAPGGASEAEMAVGPTIVNGASA